VRRKSIEGVHYSFQCTNYSISFIFQGVSKEMLL